MTEALIVIVIVAFLIGSFSWLRPSADERRRVRLRDQAMRSGLKVESIKGDVRALFEAPGQGGLLFLYWAPWAATSRVDRSALMRPRRLDTGHEIAGLPAATELPAAHRGFRGWLADVRGLGFVWDECGSPEDLARSIEFVRRRVE